METFVEGKASNKAALRQRLKLPQMPELPLAAVIVDPADTKGFELLTEALEGLLALPVQFVFIGSGEEGFRKMLRSRVEQFPERIAYKPAVDEGLHHLLMAGADIYLSSFQTETCAQNLMCSFTYGAVPVVRRMEGLTDVVEDYSPSAKKGNGFTFAHIESGGLLTAFGQALELYSDRPAWQELQCQGIGMDLSWTRSARWLEELYRQALSRPPFFS
jgi:starch synthase